MRKYILSTALAFSVITLNEGLAKTADAAKNQGLPDTVIIRPDPHAAAGSGKLIVMQNDAVYGANVGDLLVLLDESVYGVYTPDIFNKMFIPQEESGDYRLRVLEEKAALDVKLEKLGTFVNSVRLNDALPAERDRLRKQYIIMQQYSQILSDRLSGFQPVDKSDPRTRTLASPGVNIHGARTAEPPVLTAPGPLGTTEGTVAPEEVEKGGEKSTLEGAPVEDSYPTSSTSADTSVSSSDSSASSDSGGSDGGGGGSSD